MRACITELNALQGPINSVLVFFFFFFDFNLKISVYTNCVLTILIATSMNGILYLLLYASCGDRHCLCCPQYRVWLFYMAVYGRLRYNKPNAKGRDQLNYKHWVEVRWKEGLECAVHFNYCEPPFAYTIMFFSGFCRCEYIVCWIHSNVSPINVIDFTLIYAIYIYVAFNWLFNSIIAVAWTGQ